MSRIWPMALPARSRAPDGSRGTVVVEIARRRLPALGQLARRLAYIGRERAHALRRGAHRVLDPAAEALGSLARIPGQPEHRAPRRMDPVLEGILGLADLTLHLGAGAMRLGGKSSCAAPRRASADASQSAPGQGRTSARTCRAPRGRRSDCPASRADRATLRRPVRPAANSTRPASRCRRRSTRPG